MEFSLPDFLRKKMFVCSHELPVLVPPHSFLCQLACATKPGRRVSGWDPPSCLELDHYGKKFWGRLYFKKRFKEKLLPILSILLSIFSVFSSIIYPIT